ncbi:hypothetical protein HY346_02825 [Candidatus Microgenomates bacterium]|nr:hypothetical protein [Candidatus Microgenomates bacterium]
MEIYSVWELFQLLGIISLAVAACWALVRLTDRLADVRWRWTRDFYRTRGPVAWLVFGAELALAILLVASAIIGLLGLGGILTWILANTTAMLVLVAGVVLMIPACLVLYRDWRRGPSHT